MNFFNRYMSSKVTLPLEHHYLFSEFFNGIFSAIGADRQAGAEEEIARKNLEYQRERNEIEDARYEEETAYNRQFAEDERDYNRMFAADERNYQRLFAEDERAYQRALQQEIFAREDTAIERQAASLSAMGINPASVAMNGLGAGQAVAASSPAVSASASSANSPSLSSRGGEALHNDFKPTQAFANMMTPILSLANALDNINTNGFQRDKLREEADWQRLKNQEQQLINADLERKLNTEQEQREEDLRHSKTNNPNIEKDSEATANRNTREDVYQEKFGVSDGTDKYVRLATDVSNQAERATNYVEDKVGDLSRSATKSLYDSARNGLKAYNEATKKAQDWIVDKFRKGKNWIKKHTASPDEVRNMYGY